VHKQADGGQHSNRVSHLLHSIGKIVDHNTHAVDLTLELLIIGWWGSFGVIHQIVRGHGVVLYGRFFACGRPLKCDLTVKCFRVCYKMRVRGSERFARA